MADASHTNVRLRYTALMENHGTNRQQAPHWARVERERQRQIRPYKIQRRLISADRHQFVGQYLGI